MKLVSLFTSLSCASAAFIPTLSRSLTAEFNRQRHQNVEELPKFHVPVSLPKMPSLPNPLPIAFCDGLPNNPETTITGNIITSNQAAVSKLNWKIYEKLLEKEDYAGISEAYNNDAIDFSHVPRSRDFYRIFLNPECINGNQIIKGYFDSGLIADLVELEWVKYQDIVDAALESKNFYIANLALVGLIAKHQPEILSPNYKSRSLFYCFNSTQSISISAVLKENEPRRQSLNFVLDCGHGSDYFSQIEENSKLAKDYMEIYKFAKNYFHIFYNDPEMKQWMVDLRKRDITIKFTKCNV